MPRYSTGPIDGRLAAKSCLDRWASSPKPRLPGAAGLPRGHYDGMEWVCDGFRAYGFDPMEPDAEAAARTIAAYEKKKEWTPGQALDFGEILAACPLQAEACTCTRLGLYLSPPWRLDRLDIAVFARADGTAVFVERAFVTPLRLAPTSEFWSWRQVEPRGPIVGRTKLQDRVVLMPLLVETDDWEVTLVREGIEAQAHRRAASRGTP